MAAMTRTALADGLHRSVLRLNAWRIRAARRLGFAGIALLAAASLAAVAAAWDATNQHDIAQLRAHQATLERMHEVARSSIDANDGLSGQRAALASFVAGLPAADDAGDVLETLMKLAQTRSLKLSHGEYHVSLDEAGLLERHEMQLPMTGDAVAIQSFVSEALRAEPSLAIERLRVQRSATQPGQVDVQIQWVLFTRPGRDAQPQAGIAGA